MNTHIEKIVDELANKIVEVAFIPLAAMVLLAAMKIEGEKIIKRENKRKEEE